MPRLASLPPEFANVRPFAEGGFSWVYLADQTELSRTEVIKLLRRDKPGLTADSFIREGRILAKLNHKNICKVFDVKTCADGPYLRMEYVDGPTVRDYVRSRPLMLSHVVKLMVGLASALDHAHQKGIIHGDLKPENILIDRGTHEPKLIDFGIARRLESERHSSTGLHQRSYGTPAYVAPEQTYGEPPTPRSDLYSLGVILFELITGHLPFSGNKGELLEAHRTAPIPRLPPKLGVLQPLLDKMLEKVPSNRLQSLWELAEALKALKNADGMLDLAPRAYAASVAAAAERQPRFVTEAFDVDQLERVAPVPPPSRATPSPQPTQGYPEGNEILRQTRLLRVQLEAGSGMLPKGQLYYRFCEWAEGAHSIEDVQVLQDLLEITMRELGDFAPEFANVESHLRKRQRDLLLELKRRAAADALNSSRQAADRRAWLPPLSGNAYSEAQRALELDPDNPGIAAWLDELAGQVSNAVAGLIRNNAYEAGGDLVARALQAFPQQAALMAQSAAIDTAMRAEAQRNERNAAMRRLAVEFDQDPLLVAKDAARTISELSAEDSLLPGANALASSLSQWLMTVAHGDSPSAVAEARAAIGGKWDALRRMAALAPALVDLERRQEQLELQARQEARKAELVDRLSTKQLSPTEMLSSDRGSFLEAFGLARAEGFETEAMNACKAAAPVLARAFAEVARSNDGRAGDLDRWLKAAELAGVPVALTDGLKALRDRTRRESQVEHDLRSAVDRLHLGVDVEPAIRETLLQAAELGKLPGESPIAPAIRAFGDALFLAIRHCKDGERLAKLTQIEHWLSTAFAERVIALWPAGFQSALSEAAARVKIIEAECTALVEGKHFAAKPTIAGLGRFLEACRAVDPPTEWLTRQRQTVVAKLERELDDCLKRVDWAAFEQWLQASSGLVPQTWIEDRQADLRVSQVREHRRKRQTLLLTTAGGLKKAPFEALEAALAMLSGVPSDEADEHGALALAKAVDEKLRHAADHELEPLARLLEGHSEALSQYPLLDAATKSLSLRILEHRRAIEHRRRVAEILELVKKACSSDQMFGPGDNALLAVLRVARSEGVGEASAYVGEHASDIEAALDRALLAGHSATRLRQWVADAAEVVPPVLVSRLAARLESVLGEEIESKKRDAIALRLAQDFANDPQPMGAVAARLVAACKPVDLLLPGHRALVDALATWLASLARSDSLPAIVNAREALSASSDALQRVPTLAQVIAELELRHGELAFKAGRQLRKSEVLERLQPPAHHTELDWLATGAGSFLEGFGLARVEGFEAEAEEACRTRASELAGAVAQASRSNESSLRRVESWLQAAVQVGVPADLITGLQALSERTRREWRVERTLRAAVDELPGNGGTDESVCDALRQARTMAPLSAQSPVSIAVCDFGIALLAAVANCADRERLDELARVAELALLANTDSAKQWSTGLSSVIADARERIGRADAQTKAQTAARGFLAQPNLNGLQTFAAAMRELGQTPDSRPEQYADVIARLQRELESCLGKQQWRQFDTWLAAAEGLAPPNWIVDRSAQGQRARADEERQARRQQLRASAKGLSKGSPRNLVEAALTQLAQVPASESADPDTNVLVTAVAERVIQGSDGDLRWIDTLLTTHSELIDRHAALATAAQVIRKRLADEQRLSADRRQSDEILKLVRLACASEELFHRGTFGLLSVLQRARDAGVAEAGQLVLEHSSEIEARFRRTLESGKQKTAALQQWIEAGRELLPTRVAEVLTKIVESSQQSAPQRTSLTELRGAFRAEPLESARQVVTTLASIKTKTEEYYELLGDLGGWLSNSELDPVTLFSAVDPIPPALAAEPVIEAWLVKIEHLLKIQELALNFKSQRSLRSFQALAESVSDFGSRPAWVDEARAILKESVHQLDVRLQGRLVDQWADAAESFLSPSELFEAFPHRPETKSKARERSPKINDNEQDSRDGEGVSNPGILDEPEQIHFRMPGEREYTELKRRGHGTGKYAMIMIFLIIATGLAYQQFSQPSSRERAALALAAGSVDDILGSFRKLALEEHVDVSQRLLGFNATKEAAQQAAVGGRSDDAMRLYQRVKTEVEAEHRFLIQRIERDYRSRAAAAISKGDVAEAERLINRAKALHDPAAAPAAIPATENGSGASPRELKWAKERYEALLKSITATAKAEGIEAAKYVSQARLFVAEAESPKLRGKIGLQIDAYGKATVALRTGESTMFDDLSKMYRSKADVALKSNKLNEAEIFLARAKYFDVEKRKLAD